MGTRGDGSGTVWCYTLALELEGLERRNVPDALEAETLAIWEMVDREESLRLMREGTLRFQARLPEPWPAFAHDVATLSVYLFRIVKGLEVAEHYVGPQRMDDVRAWKVVARQGEWVRLPLEVRVEAGGPGGPAFHVDEDADDLDVLAARWASYPLWFQDGMRRKHPRLRSL